MKNPKQYILFIVLFCASFFCIIDGRSQTVPERSLLAISKTNHTLAIVDPVTLTIMAKIPVGEDPHELVASTNGKTAYVYDVPQKWVRCLRMIFSS